MLQRWGILNSEEIGEFLCRLPGHGVPPCPKGGKRSPGTDRLVRPSERTPRTHKLALQLTEARPMAGHSVVVMTGLRSWIQVMPQLIGKWHQEPDWTNIPIDLLL
jgi:hypothetical protein